MRSRRRGAGGGSAGSGRNRGCAPGRETEAADAGRFSGTNSGTPRVTCHSFVSSPTVSAKAERRKKPLLRLMPIVIRGRDPR